MPTIVELGSIQIRVYPGDHHPPHFHVSTTYGEAVILIADLSLIRGKLRGSDLRMVLDWARKHGSLIEDEWNRQNRG